jgi:hypothetical protein
MLGKHSIARIGQIEATLRPSPIRLIRYMPANRGTEAWLHLSFAVHRERGDWVLLLARVREFASS